MAHLLMIVFVMGQKLTALMLLIAVAGSTFNKAIALLDYTVNKNFIAATLCENRERPACCCHGKCYLKKQLQKGETDKNSSLPSRENSDIVWFCEDALQNNPGWLINDGTLFQNYLLKRYSVSLPSLFHPPGMA